MAHNNLYSVWTILDKIQETCTYFICIVDWVNVSYKYVNTAYPDLLTKHYNPEPNSLPSIIDDIKGYWTLLGGKYWKKQEIMVNTGKIVGNTRKQWEIQYLEISTLHIIYVQHWLCIVSCFHTKKVGGKIKMLNTVVCSILYVSTWHRNNACIQKVNCNLSPEGLVSFNTYILCILVFFNYFLFGSLWTSMLSLPST